MAVYRQMKINFGKQILMLTLTSMLLPLLWMAGCSATVAATPYNHQACMDTIPEYVPGLRVVSGSRTKSSIIRDMVPVTCYGHVVYHRMKDREKLTSGTIVFQVRVEYTGEVYQVKVLESGISSKRFVRAIADIIMDTDFVGWSKTDQDTVFVYPIRFGGGTF